MAEEKEARPMTASVDLIYALSARAAIERGFATKRGDTNAKLLKEAQDRIAKLTIIASKLPHSPSCNLSRWEGDFRGAKPDCNCPRAEADPIAEYDYATEGLGGT